MHRATPVNTSFRSYISGGARCLVDKTDDKKEMQECTAQFMKAEERERVECPQNYGFTSNVIESEKGGDGQIDKCSEGFVQFMGGNRAFPVIEVMDDRRFRLKDFEQGESAVYDDQQQKVHIMRERVYTRTQHKVEMRVIKDQKYMDGHGSDQSASRDQPKDKSRRWSTYVMDKDTITIERTDIVNDDDSDDPNKHTQDEPEQHIVMLSRVFLDKLHVHVLTPHISVLWDEEKHKLLLNTEFTSINLDDGENKDLKKITLQTPTQVVTIDEKERKITLQTPSTSIIMDENKKQIKISAPGTDVVVNGEIQKTQVGSTGASIPAAMLGSITSAGDKIVANVAKKVLVI